MTQYLFDFTTSTGWIPHNTSCISLDGGPNRVGARARTLAKVGPITETIEQTVVELDGRSRLVLEGRKPPSADA